VTPGLRVYLNLMSLEDLPVWSAAPVTREPEPLLTAIREAGYEGVQFIGPVTAAEQAACKRLGLGKCGLGRVNQPEDAAELARRFRDEGLECATLHVGWGLEDDDEAVRLIDAVLSASQESGVPLYVETHRATIFQDLFRCTKLVKKRPKLRLNGDFSHWYTGLEMVYGGFESKLEFIAPVLERVRFLHGRIGNPGCIQVDIGDGDPVAHPYVTHFEMLWKTCFRSFLDTAEPGGQFLFVPELLSPRIYYGRLLAPGREEESDRWQQSLVLARLARQWFAEVQSGKAKAT
jgi:hypothetical protein